jgi:hypothetical protein
MKCALAGIGFIGFAAVSLLHFVSVYRIAAHYGPDFHWVAAVGGGLLWLSFLGLVARGMYRNRLQLPMAVVFVYGMVVALSGTRVLDGVPSTIDEGKWRDPDNLLTPQTKYVLHNHSVVKKGLTRQEYDLYLAYGFAFFSGIGMVFCAGACLGPLDRDGQLFQQRRPAVWAMLNRQQPPSSALTAFRCRVFGGAISSAEEDKPPPWCPHCGSDSCR